MPSCMSSKRKFASKYERARAVAHGTVERLFSRAVNFADFAIFKDLSMKIKLIRYKMADGINLQKLNP